MLEQKKILSSIHLLDEHAIYKRFLNLQGLMPYILVDLRKIPVQFVNIFNEEFLTKGMDYIIHSKAIPISRVMTSEQHNFCDQVSKAIYMQISRSNIFWYEGGGNK